MHPRVSAEAKHLTAACVVCHRSGCAGIQAQQSFSDLQETDVSAWNQKKPEFH
jgi:hypothetical protein